MAETSQLVGIRLGQLNIQDLETHFATNTQIEELDTSKADINGNSEIDMIVKNLTVNGNILPLTSSVYDLGSTDKRFKAIYVDDLHLSTNTLYLGDTPVMGTESDVISIKADVDQGITIKTTGTGASKVISENTVEISTSGTGSITKVHATGTGSKVDITAGNQVSVTAPYLILEGETLIKGETTVNENLTIKGNLNVLGESTIVNSETLTVTDNIIEVNKGQTGSGVTAGQAGIKVDRGDASPYFMVFDEDEDMFKVGMADELEVIASHDWVIENFTHPETHLASMIVESTERRFVSDEEKITWNNKVDKETGKQLSTNDFTDELKNKLDGIEGAANNYVHPETHPASMITTSSSLQFVSAAEKSSWDAKANVTRGKSAFLGSSQEVTIAHGLGTTPASVQITPMANSSGTLGEYWCRCDETNIYVGNTGSSTVAFAWLAIK